MNSRDNVHSIVLKADGLIVLQQGPLWNKRTLPETHNEIETEWMGDMEVLCVCASVRQNKTEKHSPVTVHSFVWIHVCSLFFSMCVMYVCLFRVSLRGTSQTDCVLSPTQANNC